MLNFEKVRICAGCKKLFAPSGIQKKQTRGQSPSSGLKKTAKIALLLLLLTGIGAGVFFGYPQFSAWLAERQRIEVAQKEEAEIDRFSRVTFDADVDSYGNVYLKLPTRFRVIPPDVETLNTFPYRDKAFGTKKLDKKSGYTQPVYGPDGRISFGGEWTRYSKPQHVRMQRVSKVTKYSYSKNEMRQLIVEVDFVGVFQIIGGNTDCPVPRDPCIFSYLAEGTGQIQLIKTNDTWEFISVQGQTPFTTADVSWSKENDAFTERIAPDILVPTYEDNKIVPLPEKTYRN